HRTDLVGLGLGHHHDVLAPATPLDPEGDHVARAHARDRGHSTLDVLGEDVAAADDDDVLDTPADDELSLDQVRQVSGAQPTVAERARRLGGCPVVPGGHRCAADLEVADLGYLQGPPVFGLDGAGLQGLYGLPEPGGP